MAIAKQPFKKKFTTGACNAQVDFSSLAFFTSSTQHHTHLHLLFHEAARVQLHDFGDENWIGRNSRDHTVCLLLLRDVQYLQRYLRVEFWSQMLPLVCESKKRGYCQMVMLPLTWFYQKGGLYWCASTVVLISEHDDRWGSVPLGRWQQRRKQRPWEEKGKWVVYCMNWMM